MNRLFNIGSEELEHKYVMKPEETKIIFHSLLGLSGLTPEDVTISIPSVPAEQLWAAFKKFASIPIDCTQQAYIFESGLYPAHDDNKHFYLTFRRTFLLPFEGDLGSFYQLHFEATSLYPPDIVFKPWTVLFQVNVDDDLSLATDTFIRRVETQYDLWKLLTDRRPFKSYIFQ